MRRIRAWIGSLLALNGSARGVAGGFALGVALSLIPIPFLGMILALAAAPLLRANIPATYLGTAVVNPVTGAFFYCVELWLGLWLLGRPLPSWAELKALDAAGWWDMFTSMLGPFALGAAVMIPVFAGFSYMVVFAAVRRWRREGGLPEQPGPQTPA
jgi:uncharacterized protein (DUF2062 family)